MGAPEDFQNGQTLGVCSGETLLAPCTKEEESAEKDDQRLLLVRCSRKCWHVQ